ncbi:alanine--tRNA ligase [Natronospirillum operosum]|uniref:Alanine--tRNA ligase n=1 Tax=Natronospirillum operosum TaxID=2759953 RepID=A0A4Z0WIA9_9GAMM|nr:alanine--tRNA ligase [Natronospirillum operosum]TGG95153.1 alanine--tRNA ligase [Natronospirillum operosum]
MKTAEIRQRFLDFFARNGHEIVPSSSLVPHNDPTLLFTNAGMNQFKETFLGQEKRDYQRATTSQRCVRAGGKHNDLENVGYTARHHTFFEMLGNFSFGDYFKQDAIRFAWSFLTEELGLPAEKLLVTVYAEDDDAFDLWHKDIGVPAERIIRIGDNKGERYASDNFWQMGDTGPCGPCTEVFYDHGPEIWGGPPGTAEEDGDRFIEIWNVVFMQYNRQPDGTMEPLPAPSVDTGMGLERLAAILQGVHANYEIDLFRNLMRAVASVTGAAEQDSPSLRVVADHIRSCAFLITDGVLPSNEGRGYVLRRIIRRAVRHGNKLGASGPFFHQLVQPLVEEMGEAYPELTQARPQVERVLLQEEEQFARTLDHGMRLLEEAIADLDGKVIPGQTIFTLYDTYGFPVDLTGDIARERDLELDIEGFETAMEKQRAQARQASNFGMDLSALADLDAETHFAGYDLLSVSGTVEKILIDGKPVDALDAGQSGIVILDETAFYAESGGQVGDTGQIRGDLTVFDVEDCQKQGRAHLHFGTVSEGRLQVGDQVGSFVDSQRRHLTALHHSATHLLHAALRKVLGEHVQQKGSLVTDERLRFDFAHFEAVTPAQVRAIEELVNQQILTNVPVQTEIMPIEEAKAKGAIALFGEKYDDEVRVLTMGTDDFSVELCGGTHVRRTGDIGLFKVVSEQGISAGVRRIEAVVGPRALALVDRVSDQLNELSQVVKARPEQLVEKTEALVRRQRELEKEVERLQSKLAAQAGGDLAAQAEMVGQVKLVAARVEVADAKAMRELVDQLKNKLGSGLVLVAAELNGKVQLAAGVTRDLTGSYRAGDLVNAAAAVVGGKGGGKPDLAMAGGKDVAKIDEAIAAARNWVAAQAA